MSVTQLKSVEEINTFVSEFLTNNDIETDQWLSEENQAELSKVVSKVFASRARKSNKPARDPKAPKNPKTAYIYFCTDHREKAKQELGPDAKTTDITTKLGQMWNELKNDPKKAKVYNKYVTQAEQDKERYTKAMEEYVPSEGFTKKKVKAESTKAQSAYVFFCRDYRAQAKEEVGSEAISEISKVLGRMWSDLKSDKSRSEEYEKYVAMAAESKAQTDAKLGKGTTGTPSKATPKASAKKPASTSTSTSTSTSGAKPKAGAKPKTGAKPKAGASKTKASPKASPKGKAKAAAKGKAKIEPKQQLEQLDDGSDSDGPMSDGEFGDE